MKTVLCICTYKRPDGLHELLQAVAQLDNATDIQIVVIDNHADAQGMAVCESLPASYPFQVQAVLQPQAGISHARNAAVENALRLQPDFLAFLDDDEQPEPQWLKELLRIQGETAADIVGGPTRSVFPEGTDAAIKNNPYYGAELTVADGAACQLEAAGNFLIRASTIAELTPTYFHPAFSLSGGEDLAFFTQLAQKGARMHWAANAIVHEAVPANRLSQAWLKERVVNIANSRVRVMQMLQPGVKNSSVRCLKTVALFTVAMLLSLIGLVHAQSREKAQLLRWKFWGKFTAHLNRATIRGEGH